MGNPPITPGQQVEAKHTQKFDKHKLMHPFPVGPYVVPQALGARGFVVPMSLYSECSQLTLCSKLTGSTVHRVGPHVSP